MRYLEVQEIRQLHIEISSYCNASCPMCNRNDFGGAQNKFLKLSNWEMGWLPQIFSKELKSLQHILFCGVLGDPICNPNSFEIFNYIFENTKSSIELCTNGGLGTNSYWSDVGKLFKHWEKIIGRPNTVVFSIDGLGDTNKIYRRNVDFEKVIRNAEMFINEGGTARWEFLVFKHNEHQIEEAQKLALKLGFSSFRIRKTSRFLSSPLGLEKFPVKNKSQNIEYYLEPPTLESFKNNSLSKVDKLKNEGIDIKSVVENSKINCRYRERFKRIYIDSHAQVFPCSYVGSDTLASNGKFYSDFKEKVIDKNFDKFNSLRLHSWYEIMNSNWFNSELVDSWEKNFNNGKLLRCARQCGELFNPIDSQNMSIW